MKSAIFILLYSALFFVKDVYSLAGGSPTVAGVYPSHVLVVVNNVPFGGTILNANHVLTSSRAILNNQNELVPVSAVSIRAGSATFMAGEVFSVVAIFPHPEFNPWNFNHDVAVLRTGTNFVFLTNVTNPTIAPAELNQRILADATTCFVVGFNAPTEALPNPTLQTLQQPILNRDTPCNTAAVHNGRVLETMLCAGTVLANQGICPSTRGGGIYCNGQLAGIASSGDNCGVGTNSPGVYTQVRDHAQWINAQLTRTQIPVPGTTPTPGFPSKAPTVIMSTFLLCIAFLLANVNIH